MTTAVERHLAAINAGLVTRTNVIGIRKALAHVDRIRAGWPGNRSKATAAEADRLEAALAEKAPLVIGELVQTGHALLKNPRYRKRWTNREADIIWRNAGIRLIRFDRTHDTLVPIYRVTSRDMGSFVYRNIPWQSGGNGPEIEGRDF